MSLTCLENRMAAADLEARGNAFHLTYTRLDTRRTIFPGRIRDSSICGCVVVSFFLRLKNNCTSDPDSPVEVHMNTSVFCEYLFPEAYFSQTSIFPLGLVELRVGQLVIEV